MRIAFLLNDLQSSGGVLVALRHIVGLQKRGHEVTLVVARESYSEDLLAPSSGIRVVPMRNVPGTEGFDVALSSWWETNYSLSRIRAKSYVWFCQSMEDRFYPGTSQEAWEARGVMLAGLPVITEASWIVNQMRSWCPDQHVELAKNGIDHRVFTSQGRDKKDGPLRVLVEGQIGSRFKGVLETLRALRLCLEPIEVTHVSAGPRDDSSDDGVRRIGPLSLDQMAEVYRESDVLVKLSRVEGMFGPPLEAFGCGATAIVTPVTGHEEYIRHGENALIVPWDDAYAVAGAVDRLARERGLLRALQAGGERTARQWPSWEDSTADFERALVTLMEADEREGFPSRSIVRGLQAMGWVAVATRGPLTGPVIRPAARRRTQVRCRHLWA